MAVITEELAGCLRSWRERVSPSDVSLPAGGPRRVSGLRREEVAQLAGVSMDYLTRLEQGRAAHPSAEVVARWHARCVSATTSAPTCSGSPARRCPDRE